MSVILLKRPRLLAKLEEEKNVYVNEYFYKRWKNADEKKNENHILLTQILTISNEALTAMWMRQMYAYIEKEKKKPDRSS